MDLISEPSYGLGPKFPAIEGAKETIEEIVQKLSSLLSEEGLELNKFAKLQGVGELNLKVTAIPSEIKIEVLNPQPRLNLMGWLKSSITGVLVSPKQIVIQINRFPDLTVEVKS